MNRQRRRGRSDAMRRKLARVVVAQAERERNAARHRDPSRFPLTTRYVLTELRRRGVKLGEKEARRIRRVAEEEMLERHGGYSNRTGALVRLWRRVVGSRSSRPTSSPGTQARQVARVTRRNWWADPLMGEPDRRPPPRRILRTAQAWAGRVTYGAWSR